MPIEQQERGDIRANGRAFESRASRLGGPGRKRTRPSNRYRKDYKQSALLRTSSQAVHGVPDRVRHPACPQSPHLPGSKTAGFAGSLWRLACSARKPARIKALYLQRESSGKSPDRERVGGLTKKEKRRIPGHGEGSALASLTSHQSAAVGRLSSTARPASTPFPEW